jgi:hypothetical protein
MFLSWISIFYSVPWKHPCLWIAARYSFSYQLLFCMRGEGSLTFPGASNLSSLHYQRTRKQKSSPNAHHVSWLFLYILRPPGIMRMAFHQTFAIECRKYVFEDLHPCCCAFEESTTADRLYEAHSSRHTWNQKLTISELRPQSQLVQSRAYSPQRIMAVCWRLWLDLYHRARIRNSCADFAPWTDIDTFSCQKYILDETYYDWEGYLPACFALHQLLLEVFKSTLVPTNSN